MTGSTLLTERAVVLAQVQAAVGTPAVLSPLTDGILATNPDYSINPNKLERKFAHKDLSPLPFLIGRKLAMLKFETEIRGNGRQNSGLLADAPMLARLFNGCGYSVSSMPGNSANVGPVVPDTKNPVGPTIAWAASGALTAGFTQPILYTITVGAAEAYSVTNNDLVEDAEATGAGGTMASASAIALGTSGLSVTPTFTGAVPAGSVFRVLVLPIGIAIKPISDSQPVLSLECYYDGLKHQVTDANGTFTINATAGGYATITFDYTGQYHDTVDQDMPDPVYETTLPQQVELANLTWGSNNQLVVEQVAIDQKNSIVPRPDVNGTDGYRGVRIVSRAPDGGVNPEATLEATDPAWKDFATAQAKHFAMQVGTTPGNIVVMHGPRVQVSSIGYGDRQGIRILDKKIEFKRYLGDDELMFYLV